LLQEAVHVSHQRLHFVYVQLDALFNSLNVKGIRERSLQKELETLYEKISTALQKRSKELAQQYAVEEALVKQSERLRSAPQLTGFLAYVNRLEMPWVVVFLHSSVDQDKQIDWGTEGLGTLGRIWR
jgi:hypothetical protein